MAHAILQKGLGRKDRTSVGEGMGSTRVARQQEKLHQAVPFPNDNQVLCRYTLIRKVFPEREVLWQFLGRSGGTGTTICV
jgi:hypothetical protein